MGTYHGHSAIVYDYNNVSTLYYIHKGDGDNMHGNTFYLHRVLNTGF